MAARKNRQTSSKTGASRKKSVRAAAADIRFVFDQDGCLIYASDGVLAATGNKADLTGCGLGDLVIFDDPDEALHSQSLFGAVGAAFIDGVREGVHKIRFTGQKGDRGIMVGFDRMTGGDGRSYLVCAQTDKENAALDPAFAGQILKLAEKNGVADPRHDETVSTPGKISSQSQEGELRHFLNMSNDIMAISDKTGRFLRVNSPFNEITGYSDNVLEGMGFMDLVHPEDRPHVRNCLQGIMHDETEDGRIIDFEARIRTSDGRVLWMELRQKRSGAHVYTVGRDVTAVKSHEAALRRQAEMLSEAQAIGHMGHWHWTVGAEDIVWSDELYRIFGVEKDDYVPSMDSINALLHRRDLGRMMQAFQRAIIEKNNYEMDFRVVRPDGQTRYVRCEGKCETDDEGDVTALFGIMHDITERTLYEQQLREAKDSAERAYAAKTQFLANMSHELRTPLNAIIGFSEMMQRQLLGPIGTEKYLDYIGGIRQSGEHLLDLISDILDMSKIEAGKYELDLEELNLSKVVRLAVHMMEGRAQDAKIKIAINVENEDLQLVADRRALMQILLNLLSNAVKFTKPEGRVQIHCLERDGYVLIRIEDNGIGIPANKIKCITNPFEQAASHYTREHEGTGLGLSITKDLVELHGGNLHIDSTVDIGTCVTVRLPFNAYEQMKKKRERAASA